MLIRWGFTVIYLLLAASSYADVGSELDRWFGEMQYESTTSPGVYEGQSARYATLGGVTTRAPIREPMRIVNVQSPKFSAGCGGIDFYSGGFSAIDKDAFVDNLRAIGQNAQSLAFMLAIQVVSPQLSGQMQKAQDWANRMNAMNMDSCQAAQQLVGGGMEMLGSKNANCTLKRMQDFGEDYRTANDACTRGGQLTSTEEHGGEPNQASFVNGNLAWFVLMQDPFFRADTEFAQLMMNLTGTIIYSNDELDRITTTVIGPALRQDAMSERFNNIYKALLHGSEAEDGLMLRTCMDGGVSDPMGCMIVSEELERIDPSWQGMFDRINTLVAGIVDNIYEDNPLTDAQRGLVSTTNIPLYRYLAASAASHPRGTDVARLAKSYTEMIAADIVLRSLTSIVERVEQQSAMLPNSLGSSESAKQYRAEVGAVLSGLSDLRKEVQFDADQFFSMQQRIQMYEKALMSRLSSGLITNANWGN